ncbi:MAG TPA: tetratricopeptide repeat protein [Prolixibacteraceae bacterium]|jgi:tetratricopeptide (TPR) repeat protein
MKVSRKSLALIVISSLYLLFPNPLLSQEIIGNESLAIEYFKEKNYEKALPIFTQLINKSPGNAMYNYYYGVSLLKNNRYETATKEALLNAVVDKTPSDANFYLATYFHALENWSEAIDFYKRYEGSKKEHRELEYDKYFDMCLKRINPFKVDKGDAKNIFVDTIKVPVSLPDEKSFPIPDSLRVEWFNFQINSQLTYHNISDFRSEAAKILFTKAWIATAKNDSIVKNTDVLRKAHEETHNVTTRIALVQRIVNAEQQSYQLLRDRETYFEQARSKEAGYWEKTGAEAMATFINEIAEREKVRAEKLMNEKPKVETPSVETPVAATVTDNPEPDNKPVIEENTSAKKDNIVYKVQIGSFPNGKLTPAFKTKLAKLSKFRTIDKYTDAKKYVVYTVGNFTDYKDATVLKNQLIMEGVKGAFLAAYKNGVRVPVTSVAKGVSSK